MLAYSCILSFLRITGKKLSGSVPNLIMVCDFVIKCLKLHRRTLKHKIENHNIN